MSACLCVCECVTAPERPAIQPNHNEIKCFLSIPVDCASISDGPKDGKEAPESAYESRLRHKASQCERREVSLGDHRGCERRISSCVCHGSASLCKRKPLSYTEGERIVFLEIVFPFPWLFLQPHHHHCVLANQRRILRGMGSLLIDFLEMLVNAGKSRGKPQWQQLEPRTTGTSPTCAVRFAPQSMLSIDWNVNVLAGGERTALVTPKQNTKTGRPLRWFGLTRTRTPSWRGMACVLACHGDPSPCTGLALSGNPRAHERASERGQSVVAPYEHKTHFH